MPAKTTKSASRLGLALYHDEFDSDWKGPLYVLYDAKSLLKKFEDEFAELEIYDDPPNATISNYSLEVKRFLREFLQEYIYAMISVRAPDDTRGVIAWGASSVQASAARRGYGPLMYDIVMATEDGLIPDRNSVSSPAKKIWRKYQRRSDVTAKPLDDIYDPKTPPKIDDSQIYDEEGEEYLDSAYFISSAPQTSKLISNNKAFLKKMGTDVTLEFSDMANKFFQAKV